MTDAGTGPGFDPHDVVQTIPDRCRRCYSCVRHCPSRAIRIRQGQSEVIRERCVVCGRCIKSCSRGAKKVADNLPRARALLATGKAVAMLAPSFPAAYAWQPGQVVAATRRAGFAAVHEVAFGADLVSLRYAQRFAEAPDSLTLTTACPSAVAYVCKYAPNLVPHLAPVLSPMAALGKALKLRLRPGCLTLFVGPCTAKLAEAMDPEVSPWVDGAITFQELRDLLAERGVDPGQLPEELPDPPLSTSGRVFPLAGGLPHVAGLPSDLLDGRVHSTRTVEGFIDAVQRLSQRIAANRLSDLQARFFDLLYCHGCIAGPLLGDETSYVQRKERVLAYYRTRSTDFGATHTALDQLADLDVSRRFVPDVQEGAIPSEEDIRRILARIGKATPDDELNCRACGYRSCREKAIAVHQGLAEEDMCLPWLVERLEATVHKLDLSRAELTEAHEQLIRSERLASMGQLSAGIAHEVNNPLGTILLYANLLCESTAASAQLRDDANMILTEARRCKGIVAGLLDFARQNRVNRSWVAIRGLIEEAVRLVQAQLHGQNYDAELTFRILTPEDLAPGYLDRDQMLQVLVNLIRNSAQIMEKGGTITVSADYLAETREHRLQISDTGPGIAPESMDKLFSPFFTTRPGGRGTGLGLPICYGIVKMHQGTIKARNNDPGPGATFEVRLPAPPDEEREGEDA